MPVTTVDERLGALDHELDSLKAAFVDAIAQLDDEPSVDRTFRRRLSEIGRRLESLRVELSADDFDKHQIVTLLQSLFDVRSLVDRAGGERDLDACDALLITIERIRHIIRDAIDEHVSGIGSDRTEVLTEIRNRLPNTSWPTLARLVNVEARTLQRWIKKPEPPTRRLALVARLIAVLEHSWSEEGIVSWFDRPRRALAGRTPLSVLDDPAVEDLVVAEARSSRSQYAS